MNTHGMIFVFGSNEGGKHGAGAARFARQCKGAEQGVGVGPTGDCFAIPTKDKTIQHTLDLDTISDYICVFMSYAASNPDLNFQITQIGCGLAGLKARDIAPMFEDCAGLPNCYFDRAWQEYLPEGTNFWGTYP